MNNLKILSNKKVLYAEDELGIRLKAKEILNLFFQDVVCVDDGQKALEQIGLGIFDVLIFDICMPNVNGLEAIKKIREKDKNIPIMIFSAHTEEKYLLQAVELNITKFVLKPFSKKIFLEALNTLALNLTQNKRKVKFSKNSYYDISQKSFHVNEQKINLSKQESRFLEFLIKNKNKVLSYEEIFDYLWEFDTPSKEAIKALIKELRRKNIECIKNVYGIGYMLEL